MFVDQDKVRNWIEQNGVAVDKIEYINNGVMTDKFRVQSGKISYIARCYPTQRAWLAEMEYRYMVLFALKDVLAPKPVYYSNENPACLLYKELPGTTLRECFTFLDKLERQTLIKEIVNNYQKLASISCQGYGCIKEFDHGDESSWENFLGDEIKKTLSIAVLQKDKKTIACCKEMIQRCSEIHDVAPNLVWSDLSMDNIIIDFSHHLAGFIDFEGLMSGDPLLGIGYLRAGCDTNFASDICSTMNYKDKKNKIDFYAVLRYVRLYPYLSQPMPNGTPRDPIEKFLPYAMKITNSRYGEIY